MPVLPAAKVEAVPRSGQRVCRVVMGHTGSDGQNYLHQPKWTSVAEKRDVLYGLGCSLDQVIKA